ncbi:hypothetical protein CQJ30_15470 [Caldibacillus thermoamylovorans]|nr:hypothetical protein CQJ30_15470 [Caldibacillus thermoamylovorans]
MLIDVILLPFQLFGPNFIKKPLCDISISRQNNVIKPQAFSFHPPLYHVIIYHNHKLTLVKGTIFYNYIGTDILEGSKCLK